MKDSMNNIPAGWVWAPVNDLCQFNPKTTAEDDSACGFVPMQGLGTRYRADTSIEQRAWGDVKKAYTHFQNGDVLVAKVTPCFENGKAGIARNLPNGIGAGSSEFCVFRPHPGIDSKYLLGCFSTEDFRRRATVAMTGSVGLKRVPKDVFLGEQIPLAPAAEQTRIADKLDAVLSRVDDVNARLDRVAPLLKRFRQSVLAAATSGRLTEDWRDINDIDAAPQGMPASWVPATVRAVTADLRYGTSKKCSHTLDGIGVLRIPNISDGGRINIQDLKRADFEESEIAKLALKVGDLLIIRSNGSVDLVGKTSIVSTIEEGLLFAGYLMRLRVTLETMTPAYLYLCLSAPKQRQRIELTSKSTSGVNNINAQELQDLPISIPPLDEQTEIVRRVDILFAFADRLEARLKAARTAAQRLTPAVLAKAFRGELVAQDPADEPAAELLQRLAAQRPQAPVGAQRSRSGARS